MRLSVVRGRAACLHGNRLAGAGPPAGLIRRGNQRATTYLYSDAEIGALIAAGRLPTWAAALGLAG